MAKEHCLMRTKNWPTSRLHARQMRASIYYLGIVSRISFNACYGNCQEMFKRNAIREDSSCGQTKQVEVSVMCMFREWSVHSLLQVWFVHAHSFFLHGPWSQKQISKKKNILFFFALDCPTHSWTNVWMPFKEMKPRQEFFLSLYKTIKSYNLSSFGAVCVMQSVRTNL